MLAELFFELERPHALMYQPQAFGVKHRVAQAAVPGRSEIQVRKSILEVRFMLARNAGIDGRAEVVLELGLRYFAALPLIEVMGQAAAYFKIILDCLQGCLLFDSFACHTDAALITAFDGGLKLVQCFVERFAAVQVGLLVHGVLYHQKMSSLYSQQWFPGRLPKWRAYTQITVEEIRMPFKLLSRPPALATALGLIGFTAVLATWGPVIHEEEVTRKMKDKEHLVALKLPMQPLISQLTQEPETVEIWGGTKSRGRQYLFTAWTVLVTSDWAILNGNFAQSKCPGILTSLEEFNRYSHGLSLEDIRKLVAENKGSSVKMWGHVPRFTAAPSSLADCEDFGYDATTQYVTYKGKPIALVADTWLRYPVKV